MKSYSVILTTYNSAAHLRTTLDSILQQEGRDSLFKLELIIIDDHSTDDTKRILEEYELSFHRLAENSGGPNKGRNIGLREAAGDYICIADHDDVWHKERLMKVMPHLEHVPIVTSGYTVISKEKPVADVRICKSAEPGSNHIRFSKNETFLRKLSKSKSGQQAYLGSIAFRSELKTILFEETFGMVDYDWILRMFHQRDSIDICESLFARRVDGDNLSLDENYRMKDFEYSLGAIEQYRDDYENEVRLSRKRIYGSLARYYYLMDKMSVARKLFMKSEFGLKTLLYFITTFGGASYVRKRFKVFG